MGCVPRSKGCAACLSKHVKVFRNSKHLFDTPTDVCISLQCDESRPECTRCQKAGRHCPGYRKDMILKYYDAGGSRTNTFRSKPKRIDGVLRQDSSNLPRAPVSFTGDKLLFVSPSISTIFANQAVPALIVAISPEWQVLVPTQRYTRIWLHEVVQRADNDALLRHSTRALSLLYLGIITRTQHTIVAAYFSYTSALKKMQSMISNGNQAFANIQSAAMLLTFFEVCMNSVCNISLKSLMFK